ncbi:MAG: hypothetical protein AVDCRST_MAG75-2578 [uncultured Propionibacteriaceae bacterium]|uniref:Ceramidase n=1 Tax=uncultured Propionibacteriaceae bacterium TaxID=257457 RepID=A0A6J4P9Y9_9ACTN|nr:MAG: hypothetical protein AVDCRST_MAG75-2578 [uncultured Propionibacteriaceae bacterium]
MGFFAEPLNAISNISFLIAAWLAWLLARRTGTPSGELKMLIGLGAATGIGSILWHTMPNSLTFWLDIIPILLFIMAYIWLHTRRVLRLGAEVAVLSIAGFLLLTFVAISYAQVFHGAVVYTPGMIVVLVLGLFHAREQQIARFTLLLAAGVYLAALFFRTIDNEVCAAVPIGTHFLWHLLIGSVTYLAMRPLILALPSRR